MTLFATMASLMASIVQPTKPLYTTVVYPIQGKAAVLHDGLNIRSKRTWYQYPESLTGEEEKSTYPFDLHIDDNAVWVEPIMQTQTDNYSLQSSFMKLMEDGWVNPAMPEGGDTDPIALNPASPNPATELLVGLTPSTPPTISIGTSRCPEIPMAVRTCIASDHFSFGTSFGSGS